MKTYTFKDHLHNFSVWTAARASQRGFTSTKNIKTAIEFSGLRSFAESEEDISEEKFEGFHRQCCFEIIKSLNQQLPGKTSYGRAAKIVAIYLKTSIIIRNKGVGTPSEIIHPPIDNILLQNIHKKIDIPSISDIKWTKLTEQQYWELVSILKNSVQTFNWKLEEFWTPEI
jgi:hypothetical protein